MLGINNKKKLAEKKERTEEKSERFLLYIPPELLKELKDDAEQNFRTISGQINYVLMRYYQARRTAEAANKTS